MEAVVIRFLRWRAGRWLAMTVPAREVRVGDRMQPKGSAAGARRLLVNAVRDYSMDLADVPSLYLVMLDGRHRTADLYLPDEPVAIERRVT